MSSILFFDQPTATQHEVTGGKGANLARLTQAGFPVPPGFSITASSYAEFISENGLQPNIDAALADLSYDDPDELDAVTAKIRTMITSAPLPDRIERDIREAYDNLGTQPYVAVRSSGTAEDLAEASFAGQHDTYLDILGHAALLDAVRRCWASLWTSRATAYRQQRGFDHATVQLAVVVQTMVPSEVSGVMFTANPLTDAVNEIVINSSWGLGEGIVSGIVTPDQFILDRGTLAVKSQELGSKTVRVVRDGTSGHGTITEDVGLQDQQVFTLDGAQLAELGALGRKVTEYYDGWPQDIEWGFADDRFFLLQARDVTGVDFSWDQDLDEHSSSLPIDPDVVWTRGYADEIWCGPITPLMYSFRGEESETLFTSAHKMWGFDDTARRRAFVYHKGEAYYDAEIQFLNNTKLLPIALRDRDMFGWLPPTRQDDAMSEPFSATKVAKIFGRVALIEPEHSAHRWLSVSARRMETEIPLADGLSDDQLALLSDQELKSYLRRRMEEAVDWFAVIWTGLNTYGTLAMNSLRWMLANWYGTTDTMVMADLITGLPRQTKTLEQNSRLWHLAHRIRASDSLTALFKEHQGAEFFAVLEQREEGREFLDEYRQFVADFGHQGHADRDVIYRRRAEDPGLDYAALQAMLSSEEGDPPAEIEKRNIARRERVADQVTATIRRQPFGALKVELFKLIHNYVLEMFAMRDDERHHSDRYTYSKRRAFLELGGRLVERGKLAEIDDMYFLGYPELFELLDSKPVSERLINAKIAGRRKNYKAFESGEWSPPMFLKGGKPAPDLELVGEADVDGVLQGLGTSRGETTGTARIVRSLSEIGRVQKGDVLVVNSTDPGWTPVFLVVAATVLETGGMLAHGSCLSREYGIPAVTLPAAMSRIPDGATVTVNGDTGQIRVHDQSDD